MRDRITLSLICLFVCSALTAPVLAQAASLNVVRDSRTVAIGGVGCVPPQCNGWGGYLASPPGQGSSLGSPFDAEYDRPDLGVASVIQHSTALTSAGFEATGSATSVVSGPPNPLIAFSTFDVVFDLDEDVYGSLIGGFTLNSLPVSGPADWEQVSLLISNGGGSFSTIDLSNLRYDGVLRRGEYLLTFGVRLSLPDHPQSETVGWSLQLSLPEPESSSLLAVAMLAALALWRQPAFDAAFRSTPR